MPQITCQNLDLQFQKIKAMKLEFKQLLNQASTLADIENLKHSKTELKAKILNLRREILGSPELLVKLEKQYQESLTTGAAFNFYDPDKPVITGIDGKEYPAPTWPDILFTLTHAQLKNIKTLRNATLFVVPFGLPLKTMREKIIDKYNLTEIGHLAYLNTDADLTDQVKYLSSLQEDNEGFSKTEVLKMKGNYNRFPGWQVVVMDNGEGLLIETLGKSPESLLKEIKPKGFDVPNIEEWLFSVIQKLFEEGNLNMPSGQEIAWFNNSTTNLIDTVTLSDLLFDMYPKHFSSLIMGCRVVVRII